MPSMDRRILDRELKKGSAELIILSILEPRARHGYEISKLIEARSNGHVKFHVASLLAKLGAASRTEAVALGVRRGEVTL